MGIVYIFKHLLSRCQIYMLKTRFVYGNNDACTNVSCQFAWPVLNSTCLDTVDSFINILHFHLFIYLYPPQFLQTGCAESKKQDWARDSLSYRCRWCDANDAVWGPMLKAKTSTAFSVCLSFNLWSIIFPPLHIHKIAIFVILVLDSLLFAKYIYKYNIFNATCVQLTCNLLYLPFK